MWPSKAPIKAEIPWYERVPIDHFDLYNKQIKMIRDAFNKNDESEETEEIITEIFIKPYFIGVYADKGDEQLYNLLQYEREI